MNDAKDKFVSQFEKEHGTHPKKFKGKEEKFHAAMNASSDELVELFKEAVEEARDTPAAGLAQLFPDGR